MHRYEITDKQWHAIEELLPDKATDCGVTAKDNRLFVNAIVWLMRSGAPWADLPGRFGLANTVGQRYRRWAKQGVWQRVFEAMQAPDLGSVMLDSTSMRAHQHAAGQKKATPRPSVSAGAAGA